MKKKPLLLALCASATLALAACASDGHHDHDMHEHDHDMHHHDMSHGEHHEIEFTGQETILEAVEFNRCWVRLIPGGRPSAAYFELRNTGNEPISLLGARADNFKDVMLHKTIIEDGVMKMDMLEEVRVEPAQTAVFEPRANHVMLTADPADAVAIGDEVNLQFKFEGEQVASTTCIVKPINALSFD